MKTLEQMQKEKETHYKKYINSKSRGLEDYIKEKTYMINTVIYVKLGFLKCNNDII